MGQSLDSRQCLLSSFAGQLPYRLPSAFASDECFARRSRDNERGDSTVVQAAREIYPLAA